MAGSELTDLTPAVVGDLDDDTLLYIVTDPAGTPADKSLALSVLRDRLSGDFVWGPMVPTYGLPTPGGYGTTGAAIQEDRMMFTGLPIVSQRTWTRLGVDVYSAGGAAWVGLYRVEGWRDSPPGTLHLVRDFGTFDMSVVGPVENVVSSFALPAGFYAVGARLEPGATGNLRRVEGPGRMWEVFHPSAPAIRNYAPFLTVTPGAKPETITHFTSIAAGGGPFAWIR